jgi:hypothetical protein
MQTTLARHPQLFKETNSLIERSLNYPSTENFAVDFYPVMNPQNFKNNHILYNNEVMAHIGVNFRELIGREITLPVALFGGVAVKDKHRGQGYLKLLLNQLIKKHEKEVGLFILWSDLTQLYQKFDFFPAGVFIDNNLEEIFPKHYTKTKFNRLNSKDLKQIQMIYSNVLCQEYFTFKRDNNHWPMIKNIDSTDLYLSRNEKGDITSYFCRGKGGDLKGVIHEVGYLPENREQVLKDLSSSRLWRPTLGKEGEDLKFLGLFRIGNPKIFGDFLLKRSNGDLRLIDVKNNLVTFGFNHVKYSLPSEDFLQYIFGPFPPKEFENFACKLFFSGLDSI